MKEKIKNKKVLILVIICISIVVWLNLFLNNKEEPIDVIIWKCRNYYCENWCFIPWESLKINECIDDNGVWHYK
jgi:hypothetical protein